MIIDSHIHLNAPDYNAELQALLLEAIDEQVKYFICVGAGYGAESAVQAVELSKKYDYIFASVGIHPHDVDEKFNFESIEELSVHSKVLAIGETGLDYAKEYSSKENQFKYFRKQIELAQVTKKPLIIHSRGAANDCYEILKEMEAEKIGGVFHCYAEDARFAEKLYDINFMVSFPGIITFKNATEAQQAAKEIPLEQIMIETDGPFLAPTPYRGKLCRPAYIIETAKKLAELKDMDLEELCKKLSENTIKFFKLPIKAER